MRRADSKKPSRRGRAGPDKDFLGKFKKQPVLLSAAICSPSAFSFINKYTDFPGKVQSKGRNILQVQQHIGPENVAARFHRQIAVIPVHGSFDGNKADALSVMLGGAQNAALLFQHAIVAVLHH